MVKLWSLKCLYNRHWKVKLLSGHRFLNICLISSFKIYYLWKLNFSFNCFSILIPLILGWKCPFKTHNTFFFVHFWCIFVLKCILFLKKLKKQLGCISIVPYKIRILFQSNCYVLQLANSCFTCHLLVEILFLRA